MLIPEMAERFYLCIDLKSFFASVEAVERGLDPFTTNLVVADSSRGRALHDDWKNTVSMPCMV
ncbi:MAG: hypothetical protein R8M70_03160 [Alphaproteobacteria bacterium]|nr:hypothetical protein [Alphaproteobacteria bacterium]